MPPRTAQCTGEWPAAFAPEADVVSLHYDCASDPDDLESVVADRAMLETKFGRAWVRAHALAVAGTFGTNERYERVACERVLEACWRSLGGFLRAGADARDETEALREVASDELARFWNASVVRGGQVYVKEGGQSDLTRLAVSKLDRLRPGAARCVHVVQHSAWNEAHNSEGVTAWVRENADYVGPLATGSGPVDDGNALLQRPSPAHVPIPPGFAAAARRSWLGCAWNLAFETFEELESWCPGAPRFSTPHQCVDFSDTHALAYILRIAPLTMERFQVEFLGAQSAHGDPAEDCSGQSRGSSFLQRVEAHAACLGTRIAGTAAVAVCVGILAARARWRWKAAQACADSRIACTGRTGFTIGLALAD